jgi:hypothetical protein
MEARLKVIGLRELILKTNPKLLARPLRRFFERAYTRLEGAGKRRAPVDMGRLRNSLTHEVDRHLLPLWAKVGTNVKADGFPYASALDAGGWQDETGQHTYHYVGGGALALAGQPTEGWFTHHALEESRDDIKRYVKDIGTDVQREWDSNA